MDAIPTDITQWFADSAVLGGVVAALVSLLRKHLLKTLDGPAVVGVSIGLGVGIAYLGQALGYALPQHPVLYGVSAGLIASGGTDFIRKLTGGKGQGEAPKPSDSGKERERLL